MKPIKDHPIITGFGAAVGGVAALFALFEVYDYLETSKIEMAKQTEILEAQRQLDVRWERNDIQWNNELKLDHGIIKSDIAIIKSDVREIREHLLQLRTTTTNKEEIKNAN